MNRALEITSDIIIPADELEISAVRSSGPGGQNVNKVSTCIELRFNPERCGLFSTAVLTRLMALVGNRIDSEGNILITSQRYREQYRNLDDALEKLKKMILQALKPPKPRKPTRPGRAAIERRIDKKKQTGEKKARRQKRDWQD